MKFKIIIAVLVALPAASFAQGRGDDILLRRNDGRYERANPGGAGGYYTRPEGDTYTGVYDRKGDRVGTIKNDAGGARLYDNRGNRR